MIMRKIRKALESKEGFTLVELLVVIAVLGILAAIAVPRFADMRAKARETKAIAEVKQVQTGLELYYAEHGVYPADGADLDAADGPLIEYINVEDLANFDLEYELDANGVYTITATYDSNGDDSVDVGSDAALTITRDNIE